MVQNPPANAGDTGVISGLGRSHTPQSSEACAPQLLKCAHPGAGAPQREKPPQREARHRSEEAPLQAMKATLQKARVQKPKEIS